MFESLEDDWRSIQSEISQRAKFSPVELAYVDEIVPEHNIDLLIARIDELNPCEPPKAIDSDPKIANLIEPIIDEIDTTYLEAPQDSLQIEGIADQMADMEGLERTILAGAYGCIETGGRTCGRDCASTILRIGNKRTWCRTLGLLFQRRKQDYIE